jgi:hypothetical protein
MLQSALNVREVNVTINQSGQYRGLAEVDDFCARRNLYFVGWANVRDFIAGNKDDLIGQIRSGLRVKHFSGANGRNLTLRGGHDGRREDQEGNAEH